MKIKRVSSFQIVQDDGTDVPDDIKEIIDALMEGFCKDRVLGPNSAVPTSALLKMALSVLRRFSVQITPDVMDASSTCITCGVEMMYEGPENFDPVCMNDSGDVHCEGCCSCGELEEMRINALDDAALDAKRDAMQDEMAK